MRCFVWTRWMSVEAQSALRLIGAMRQANRQNAPAAWQSCRGVAADNEVWRPKSMFDASYMACPVAWKQLTRIAPRVGEPL